MGGIWSLCCAREEEIEEAPVELQPRRQSREGSLLDPQSFDFVEALHLPPSSASQVPSAKGESPTSSALEMPLRRHSKRHSLTAWLAGGFFSSRQGRGAAAAGGSSASLAESVSSREKMGAMKILMSGPGESGKSTVIKQMKIIHQGGFTIEELHDFRPQIYRNTHDSMLQILDAMDPAELLREECTLESAWIVRKFKPNFEELDELPAEYVDAINHLWVELIRNSFEAISRKCYILDSAPYFFDSIDRIAQPGYLPTNEDVLRARGMTTGVNEYTFRSGMLSVVMVDVGGQRSERRKWIETFNNVTMVIFCVAISEYDQMLREEPRQNRLLESFQLWESMINNRWFQHASFVLFLNKKDIFRTKLRTNPIERYFPEYRPLPEGSPEEAVYEHAAEYLRNQFLAMNYGRVPVYPFLTCATDTKNIDLVFGAVKETVLMNNLRNAGFF